jgi:hypothetical protein
VVLGCTTHGELREEMSAEDRRPWTGEARLCYETETARIRDTEKDKRI